MGSRRAARNVVGLVPAKTNDIRRNQTRAVELELNWMNFDSFCSLILATLCAFMWFVQFIHWQVAHLLRTPSLSALRSCVMLPRSALKQSPMQFLDGKLCWDRHSFQEPRFFEPLSLVPLKVPSDFTVWKIRNVELMTGCHFLALEVKSRIVSVDFASSNKSEESFWCSACRSSTSITCWFALCSRKTLKSTRLFVLLLKTWQQTRSTRLRRPLMPSSSTKLVLQQRQFSWTAVPSCCGGWFAL